MTATRPQPRPGVLDIAPYIPGKSTAPGVAKVFKLSSNETPLGPSPKAIAAYNAVARHLEDYPDGSASDLRDAIGRVFGLDPDRMAVAGDSVGGCMTAALTLMAEGRGDVHFIHQSMYYPVTDAAMDTPPTSSSRRATT